jgi:hypothetical protein
VIVAPLGVTVSGIATLDCAGSFVNRLSDPASGIAATEDPGTLAVMVSVPVDPPSLSPAGMDRAVGVAEKAFPVVDAVIAKGLVPKFRIVSVAVAVWLHATSPASIEVDEKTATGAPASPCPASWPPVSTRLTSAGLASATGGTLVVASDPPSGAVAAATCEAVSSPAPHPARTEAEATTTETAKRAHTERALLVPPLP